MADTMKLKWGEKEVVFKPVNRHTWTAKVCKVTVTVWYEVRWYCDCNLDGQWRRGSGYTMQDALDEGRRQLEEYVKEMQEVVDNMRATVDFGKANQAPVAAVREGAIDPWESSLKWGSIPLTFRLRGDRRWTTIVGDLELGLHRSYGSFPWHAVSKAHPDITSAFGATAQKALDALLDALHARGLAALGLK
jgi:hypothetical protein